MNSECPDHQPNTLHWQRGDDGLHVGFGDFYKVQAVFPLGDGHDPYLQVTSKWGARMDVTEEWAAAFLRWAPAELAKMHHRSQLSTVHDAVEAGDD